jgi:hypothetical protein
VKSLSAKYGPPSAVAPPSDSAKHEPTDPHAEPIASWEDSQTSINLVRSSFSGDFDLVITAKSPNAEAEFALVESAKLDKQQEPQREADRQKKEVDDLQLTRLKNQKSFRP